MSKPLRYLGWFPSIFKAFEQLSLGRTCIRIALLLVPMLGSSTMSFATTCPAATIINPASLPITNQALICGAANDLNSTNVPGTLCGTGDNAGYKDGNEALYVFTPTTTGNYSISVSGQAWSSIQVWAGCPNGGGTCVYGDGNAGTATTISVALNAATVYYIWFDTWPTPNSPCPGVFSISLPPPPAPACGNAFTDPGGAGNYANNVNVTYVYCPAIVGHVVTLNFTQFNTEAGWDIVTIYNGPSTASPVLGTYSGTTIPGPISSSAAGGCLTLRFTSDGSGVAPGWAGTVSCAPPVPPPPSCGTVVYDPGGAGGNYANNANFTATYCPTIAGQVVTMTFTAFNTEAGLDILNVYNGPSTASPLIGSFSGAALPGAVTATNAGGCLTIRFTSDISITALGWAANITCGAPPPPPAYDNPCGGTLLTVNTNCVFSAGTTLNATGTVGPPPPTCANYVNDDVWFRTVVPASGNIIIETAAGSLTDAGMAVYSAPACAGPFTQIACDDDSGPGFMPALTLNGLAPGSTVYIRVWEFGGDNNGTFSICVRTPPPPPAGDCVYVLNLFDSFGDGWDASRVGVSINGGANTWYTVTGSTLQVLIGLNIGQSIVLTYDNSGTFQFENSYTLGLMNGGVYFNSGSPPTAGISFAQSVDCVPPPAAPQDCAGGATICNGQSFNNNSTNTGNVVDLNTANQGCLTAGERQGTWYYFSPSASGTLGFTITPSVVTDYDFAIWGPMSSIACPPVSAPVRCSFAAPTGPTGLGNGATDFTEGAGGDRFVAPMNVTTGQIYIMYVDNFSSNGQSFALNWNLSGGASLDCTVLPVELLELSATPLKEEVVLSWTTVSENNSSHFVVQRSQDGSRFDPIGSVDAAGTTQSLVDYKFLDDAPIIGINYYRLIQVDMNGTEKMSNMVHALFRSSNGSAVVVPNPMLDNASVYFDQLAEDGMTLRITDAGGRIVMNIPMQLAAGARQFEFSLAGFDAGAYFLTLTSASGSVTHHARFVKQ